ncbi:MAG: hypothetical protein APR63_01160 [Desulfuromonas sp. SDB]|nr:MAG: hypothetical protein APR63_01160 [Desulfuromonas sp. SDB]
MHILIPTAEIYPYAKVGGMGDMVAALSRHLSKLGHDVRIVLPYYRNIKNLNLDHQIFLNNFKVNLPFKTINCRVLEYLETDSGVILYFIDYPEYFDREGIYNDRQKDYPDNPERFIFFSYAALLLTKHFDFHVDVLHGHDWPTGLIMPLLKCGIKWSAQIEEVKTVFTIHNLAYQGNYPLSYFKSIGLPESFLHHQDGLEFFGQISFLKAGIAYADHITTVSITYAREIQTDAGGCGLQGLLQKRKESITGILNGIDESIWNPLTDSYLTNHYDISTIEQKKLCKQDLQQKMGLHPDLNIPLIGGISRLVFQKGFDIVASALVDLLAENIQFALLGTGDDQIESQLTEISKHYSNFKFYNGYSEHLAHLIIAGCDIFIVPSRYEPCGLTQLYSLKYGTIPVVHATGGLEDSVNNIKDSTGNGIKFSPLTPYNLKIAILKAVELYQDDRDRWKKIMINGMKENHNWDYQILQYHNLYRSLTRIMHP